MDGKREEASLTCFGQTRLLLTDFTDMEWRKVMIMVGEDEEGGWDEVKETEEGDERG